MKISASGSPETAREIDIASAWARCGGTCTALGPGSGAGVFSTKRAWSKCGNRISELDPRLFSFNSKHGCVKAALEGTATAQFDAEQAAKSPCGAETRTNRRDLSRMRGAGA